MTYSIADWQERYENNRTRELKAMTWVPVPNSHDGDGYTQLVCRENGAAYLGAWLAILQVASKCDPRGTLLRDNGKPHDATSISRMTRLPVEIIQGALDVCLNECNWLTVNVPQEGAAIPQEGAAIPHPTDEEGKGREGKGKKGSPSPLPAGIDDLEDIGSGVLSNLEASGAKRTSEPVSAPARDPHPDARAALRWLNEQTGRHYRETGGNLGVISARLREAGVDLEGVKLMISRQCQLWGADAKMEQYLRPETLFGKQKFDGYYASRLVPVRLERGQVQTGGAEWCPGWRNKPWEQMTEREQVAYAQS